jgi:plasmid segregation protein ParM
MTTAQAGMTTATYGVDDGHAFIKVFDGERYAKVPARAKAGRAFTGANEVLLKTEGGDFSVGQYLSDPIDTRTSDYPFSAANRVLVHYALRAAGAAGDVVIETGLPIARYYDITAGMKNESVIARKKDSLTLPVRFETAQGDSGEVIKVVGHGVSPEAVGSYFDMSVDLQGNATAFGQLASTGVVTIIDIGGRTTDVATFNPDGSVSFSHSGTALDWGILKLLDRVASYLKQKFDAETIMPDLVEQAMATGEFRYSGVTANIAQDIKKIKADYARELVAMIKPMCGAIQMHNAVGFVGGGSYHIADDLADALGVKNQMHTVEQAEYSNARGFWKVAKHIRGA